VTWGDTSRHARGYNTRWDKLRKRILARDMHLCQPCLDAGIATPAREVDHITPKANGGTDDADNLQAICTPCHQDKTAREAAEAQGRQPKKRLAFDADGFPVW
jgi:5-methylcytosine-specific restriction protein A